jgi:hypothetical protein
MTEKLADYALEEGWSITICRLSAHRARRREAGLQVFGAGLQHREEHAVSDEETQ